ncbi:MAG TPA: SLBB domain-containing protein, partial [Burkholderiaceae bacterium]
MLLASTSPGAAAQAQGSTRQDETAAGPVRLSTPAREREQDEIPIRRVRQSQVPRRVQVQPNGQGEIEIAPRSSEFETYLRGLLPKDTEISRYGSDLMEETSQVPDADGSALIPPDYLIGVGDEIRLGLWGSVEGDLRLVVDRTGRISVPRVGPVMVAGLRYAELGEVIEKRAAKIFRNFHLTATLERLRSIRVYVTGFAKKPGAHTVGSLATLVNALMQAGGPADAGSFRRIELRRGGKLASSFDLYDLLIRGDRSGDLPLRANDVIYIGPVGAEAAVIGSVNHIGIFELKPGESVNDLLAMAGGFGSVADRSRVMIEPLARRNDSRITELQLPKDGGYQPQAGDVVRVLSAINATLPQQKQNKRVRIEGEVAHPGEYILPPNGRMADAVQAAGGMTPGAYVFGTEFTRESVRLTQEQNYDRALRDLETELTRNVTTQRASTGEEAVAQTARTASTSKLVERLRAVRPTGRIVLQMSPTASELPDLPMEDGDRISIPARPTAIGVFGSVFNGGSYLFGKGGSIEDFLKLAGGPTRGADADSIFVVRANGSVVSARQSSSWFGAS